MDLALNPQKSSKRNDMNNNVAEKHLSIRFFLGFVAFLPIKPGLNGRFPKLATAPCQSNKQAVW